MDRSEACRVLGVDREASEKEIREAYEDLLEVWDPTKYPEDGRLRRRSARQRAEIEKAYRALRETPPRSGAPSGDLYGAIFAERPPKKERAGASKQEPPDDGSLLSQTISTRERPSKARHPVWISAGAFSLVVVAVLVAQFLPTREPTSETGGILEEHIAPETAQPETTEATDTTGIAESSSQSVQKAPPPPREKPQAGDQAGRPEGRKPALSSVEPKQPPPVRTLPENRRPVLVREEASKTSSRQAKQQGGKPAAAPSAAKEADAGEAPEATTAEPPGPDAESLEAFNVLKAKSEAAVRLLAYLIDEFEFQEWKPVQRSGDSILIDLQALRKSDQQLVHFIWTVDVKADTARPLSQAARDLETRLKRPPG